VSDGPARLMIEVLFRISPISKDMPGDPPGENGMMVAGAGSGCIIRINIRPAGHGKPGSWN